MKSKIQTLAITLFAFVALATSCAAQTGQVPIKDGGNFARAFEIRKKVEDSSIGEFYICNVPVGRYEMTVKQANGKPLKMKQKNPTDSVFGIQPAETSGSASLIFNPLSAEAKTATASRGNWTDLEIIIERL